MCVRVRTYVRMYLSGIYASLECNDVLVIEQLGAFWKFTAVYYRMYVHVCRYNTCLVIQTP